MENLFPIHHLSDIVDGSLEAPAENTPDGLENPLLLYGNRRTG